MTSQSLFMSSCVCNNWKPFTASVRVIIRIVFMVIYFDNLSSKPWLFKRFLRQQRKTLQSIISEGVAAFHFYWIQPLKWSFHNEIVSTEENIISFSFSALLFSVCVMYNWRRYKLKNILYELTFYWTGFANFSNIISFKQNLVIPYFKLQKIITLKCFH